jgi:hypothetical protein
MIAGQEREARRGQDSERELANVAKLSENRDDFSGFSSISGH